MNGALHNYLGGLLGQAALMRECPKCLPFVCLAVGLGILRAVGILGIGRWHFGLLAVGIVGFLHERRTKLGDVLPPPNNCTASPCRPPHPVVKCTVTNNRQVYLCCLLVPLFVICYLEAGNASAAGNNAETATPAAKGDAKAGAKAAGKDAAKGAAADAGKGKGKEKGTEKKGDAKADAKNASKA